MVGGRQGGGRVRRGEQGGRRGRGFVLGITRGGWRWLEVVGGGQGGGRGRRGEQGGRRSRGFVLGTTRCGYRWLFEVVGDCWRWSEVDEEEDERNCVSKPY
ncbi:uncharacterized protein [Neodiprion pinetum]|uniref:uncharacterized protein n=1 Tax=Neodiprion pinetum TaxID=441929 RepID=UPI00371F3C15